MTTILFDSDLLEAGVSRAADRLENGGGTPLAFCPANVLSETAGALKAVPPKALNP